MRVKLEGHFEKEATDNDDARAPGWRTRIPFFLAPNGAFNMGNVGDEHWEIPDDDAVNTGVREAFEREYPGYPHVDGDYWRDHQGQVNFDPESGEMKAHWPMDWNTMQPKAWITPEMQQAVLADVAERIIDDEAVFQAALLRYRAVEVNV